MHKGDQLTQACNKASITLSPVTEWAHATTHMADPYATSLPCPGMHAAPAGFGVTHMPTAVEVPVLRAP